MVHGRAVDRHIGLGKTGRIMRTRLENKALSALILSSRGVQPKLAPPALDALESCLSWDRSRSMTSLEKRVLTHGSDRASRAHVHPRSKVGGSS